MPESEILFSFAVILPNPPVNHAILSLHNLLKGNMHTIEKNGCAVSCASRHCNPNYRGDSTGFFPWIMGKSKNVICLCISVVALKSLQGAFLFDTGRLRADRIPAMKCSGDSAWVNTYESE